MPDNDQRQILLNLAAQAFARHGYAGASVRTITDAANMNPAMVGYYFESKEGLFRAVLEDRAARIRERTDWAQRGSDAPGAARQRAFIHAVLEDYPEFLHILFAHAIFSNDGFPTSICREQLAAYREKLENSALLDELAAELLAPTIPLMQRSETEREALANSLIPKPPQERKTPTAKSRPIPPPNQEPKDEPPQYTQPSPGDDFLDGFVD